MNRITLLPIEREYVEHPSESGQKYLAESIADLAKLWVTEAVPSKAELTISGYDNDPRELYEIPEVCEWARNTIKELPVLLFFITEASIVPFIGWLCGPLSKQEIDSPDFLKRFEDVKKKYTIKAGAESFEYFARMGFDKKAVTKLFLQIVTEDNNIFKDAFKVGD